MIDLFQELWTGRRGRVELYHEHGLGVMVIAAGGSARGLSILTVQVLALPNEIATPKKSAQR